MIEFFEKLWFLFRHLGEDTAWSNLLTFIGKPAMYVTLFGIIFLETGVVIFPFLPGDSLLFALGAMSARDVGIDFWTIFFLLWVAAVIGDAVNYWIGYKLGPAVFRRDDPSLMPTDPSAQVEYAKVAPKKSWWDRLLNKKHLEKAQEFYQKHGGKTIILARFVPIIRTFAPFVAGVGKMSYIRFGAYNVIGGLLWVAICMAAGRLFGGIEFVKKNFELVIIAIIIISVLPMAFEFVKAKRAAKTGGNPILEATTIGEKVD